MKFYAEITVNLKPKNKAEEACQNMAKNYNRALIGSKEIRDVLINDFKRTVDKINKDNRRCGDVKISHWTHEDEKTVAFGDSTHITFKKIVTEINQK